MFKKLSIDAIQALVKSYFQYKKNQKQERKSLRALERDVMKPRLQDADESVPEPLKGDQQVQDLSPDFSDHDHSGQRGTDKEVPVMVEEQEESDENAGDAQESGKRELEAESSDDGSSSGQFGEEVVRADEAREAEFAEL